MTKQEVDNYWKYAFSLRIYAKVGEFLLQEKQPRHKLKNPNLNNHLKRIRESAEYILKEAAFSLTDLNTDYNANHSYALYRIFDSLHLCLEEELFSIAEDLCRQNKEIEQIGTVTDSKVHKELMAKMYVLDAKGKERLLKLANKIEKENEKKLQTA